MYPKLQAVLTLENNGFKKVLFFLNWSNSPKEPFFFLLWRIFQYSYELFHWC